MNRPRIVVDPAVRWGRPVLEGTRTATVDVAGMVAAGEAVATVCDEYDLTRHQVLLACWHEAVNGGREVWAEWAAVVQPALASDSPAAAEALPDPPKVTPPTNPLFDPDCDHGKPIPGAGCARTMHTCRYPECTYPEAATPDPRLGGHP